MSVEAIGIETRRRSADLDQMSEDPLEFVWILNDCDNFHLRAAFRAHHRIDLADLCKKPGPGAFARIDVDLFISVRQWLVARIIYDTTALMGGFPSLWCPFYNPRHLAPSPFCAGGIKPVAPDELESPRWNMLGELREEIKRIKHVEVLFEVLRVCGVEQNLPLEWLVADFLERYGWPCDVLGEALLGGLVEDANAVVDAEAGMLPGQEVPGKVLVQEFALYQEIRNS